jgi:hypothetical protein
MMNRTEPCKFSVKESYAESKIEYIDGQEVRKVKKIMHKLDENGQPMYETRDVVVKKGCRCKKNQTEEVVQKRVPVTEEIWVEEPVKVQVEKVINESEPMLICKLYGKVKKSYCQKCSTYKVRR